MKIQVEDIVVEKTVYPRSYEDWRVGYGYYRAMKAGAVFPKIAVAKIDGNHILVDGKNRLTAYKLNKTASIDVEVIQCKNLDEIYLEAIRRNITHGSPLEYGEKVEIYRRLKSTMTKNSISSLLQVTVKDLEKMEVNRIRITDSGKEITVKPPISKITSIGNVTEENQQILTGATQLSLINQLLTIITNGWLDTNNEKIVDAFNTLKQIMTKMK